MHPGLGARFFRRMGPQFVAPPELIEGIWPNSGKNHSEWRENPEKWSPANKKHVHACAQRFTMGFYMILPSIFGRLMEVTLFWIDLLLGCYLATLVFFCDLSTMVWYSFSPGLLLRVRREGFAYRAYRLPPPFHTLWGVNVTYNFLCPQPLGICYLMLPAYIFTCIYPPGGIAKVKVSWNYHIW